MRKQSFIFSCCFFMALGLNILGLSLVYLLADRFSFNPGQIGVYMALGNIFYFVGCNLGHRLSSIFGPLKILAFSSTLVFLASIPLGYVKSSGIVYAAYWALQLSGGIYWPPVMGWLTAGLGEKEMNRVIGVFNRSWMMGNILGPLIAGPLYQWNTNASFMVVNLAYFLAPVSLFLMSRLSREENVISAGALVEGKELLSDGPPAGAPASAAPTLDRTDPPVSRATNKTFDLYRYRGWLSGLCSAVFIGVMVNIVPIHIRDGLGYTERSAGLLLFIRCAASFAGFALLAKFTRWHFSRRWFFILQGTLIFAALLFLPARGKISVYFVIAVLYGLLNSACYTNSIFYSGATGRNPKKNLAFHEIFLCIGSAIGSAGGGFFYGRFGFTGTCIALLLTLGAGLGIFVFLDRREYSRSGKS